MRSLWLHTLSLVQFKNHPGLELTFSDGCNALVGFNGQGKTNVLDAIHYLCLTKSFFHGSDASNIRNEEAAFVLQGRFERDQQPENLLLSVPREGAKILRRNQKEVARMADHIGLFPLVMVSPSDAGLITEGSDVRRKLVDGLIAQLERPFLESLMAYNRSLAQRNALLKTIQAGNRAGFAQLDVWDHTLANHAAPVHRRRTEVLEEWAPVFLQLYQALSGGRETVSLRLVPGGSANLLQDLESHRQRDVQAGHTTTGPHRDDLEFLLDGRPLKRFASQGQQKTFLLSLRLAQYQWLTKRSGFRPLLLLDDVADKLDEQRLAALLHTLQAAEVGQVFLTDTDETRIRKLLAGLGGAHTLHLLQPGMATPVSVS